MKHIEKKRFILISRYIFLSQVLFFLLIGIMVLRSSSFSYENLFEKIPTVIMFAILLALIPLLQKINLGFDRQNMIFELILIFIYLFLTGYLLINENKDIFKIALLMPVIITGLKYGITMAMLSAFLSIASLFVIGFNKNFTDIDVDIMISGFILLIAWLLGNMTETEKNIRNELKKSETKFRELFHKANDSIFLYEVTPDERPGRFIEVNDVACRTFGYTRNEILKMTPRDIHCEKRFKEVEHLIKNSAHQKQKTFETRCVSKTGTKIPMEISSHVFSLNGKKVVLSIARDITQRKLAEKALRESEERYRLLVELSPDAIIVHREGKVVFANTAAAKLIGVEDPKELQGRPVIDFVHPEYREFVRERIQKGYNGEMVPLAEEKIVRLDNGSTVDVEVTAIPFPYKGETAVQVVIRDITERKLLHEALEYDRIKTEFFTNISHEFRTPLNVIFTTLQLMNANLNEKAARADGKNIRKYLDLIKQNCFRLLRLVNNFIDITKIDSGFFELNLRNHNIVSVVEEITLSVAEYIKNKGITFRFDTDVEEKIMACDADKIERIMLNLLSNAVKFTKAGGGIMVNVCDRGEKVVISVKDTGIGIPKNKQKVIFERFRQVDKSFTREHEGSGIGLSLVKSLVEMHGGKISLRSKEGEGCEFIIELPARVLPEKEEVCRERDFIHKENMEKINIEFSDIYR